MSEQGAYGKQLGEAFHVRAAPSFVTRSLQKTEIAVTEIKCDIVDNARTLPVPHENAFLVKLQIRDLMKRKLWVDGRQVDALPLKAGSLSIFDLRRTWIGERVAALHAISFYLPRAALNAIADMEGIPRIDRFDQDPATGVSDATVASLGASLLPAFERPEEANYLFVDHITCATAAHILYTYGVRKDPPARLGPDLAPWQVQRAKDMLLANLQGNISIAELANECGLTISKFSKGFALSTGLTPHKWLLEQRVQRSMCLLRSELALDEIAVECGFFDARHFVRTFTRVVGAHPRAWQRAIKH
jgi:AraC family transcriptional regulator